MNKYLFLKNILYLIIPLVYEGSYLYPKKPKDINKYLANLKLSANFKILDT